MPVESERKMWRTCSIANAPSVDHWLSFSYEEKLAAKPTDEVAAERRKY